jgi:septal ring factor EnvC (AmiA/AmiB activator)
VKVSYSNIARGAGSTGHTDPTSESTQATTTGKTQATATVAESVENRLGSGPTAKQPEGAITGLSSLERKMDKIDQERKLFKAEHAKMEDDVSSVTNSLSKLGDKILEIWQDMIKLSSTLREEQEELKQFFCQHEWNKKCTLAKTQSSSVKSKKRLGISVIK